MKKMVLLSSIMLCGLIAFAQNTLHDAKVVGSFDLGVQKVSAIMDEETGCIHKTNPHADGLFNIGENVKLDFDGNNQIIEVIKINLPQQVFANKNCDGSVPTGVFAKLQFGWGRTCEPGEPAQGDWKCGKCPALCVRWIRAAAISSNGDNGTVEIDAKVEENQFIIRINDASILPQNGIIEIKNNEPLTSEISRMYGYNMIILKKGSYVINTENEVNIDANFKP